MKCIRREMRELALALMVCVISAATLAHAENWSNWRGPYGNGSAAGSGYPTKWSATENLAWRYDLPGQGALTPAIWDDHIFLTLVVADKNMAICLSRAGDEKWQVEFGAAREGKHKKATGANSSPVTDGKHVYFYFKSGDLACLDFDGHIVWQKNLQQEYGDDTLWWDLGTSPVLAGDQLIVTCQQDGPSYVVALDKRTGEVVWKQPRQFKVPREADQSYTTPVVLLSGEGEGLLIILGADHVTAHRLENGSETWRCAELNPERQDFFRSIASPVLAGDLLLAPYARGESLTAIRLGGHGDVTDTHVVWISDKSADVPTPAVAGDRIYVCRDKNIAVCLNAASGDVIWEESLEKRNVAFSSSPVVADGKVYFTREDGTTFVVADAETFELLGKNSVGEHTVATPVLVDGRVYLRTLDSLFCFE